MRPFTTNLLLTTLTCAAFLTDIAMPAKAVEYGKPAIENGKPDSAYVNVGAVGFDTDGPTGHEDPRGVCTGFVISDRAFVTAAHCIAPFQHMALTWAVTLEPGSPEKPIINPVIFTGINFPPILVETESTMTVHLHPRFIPEACNPESCEYDVAVLEFPAGTFKVPPVRLARFGLLKWLKRLGILRRLPIGVVGYGGVGIDKNDDGDFGVSIPGYRNRGFSSIGRISRTGLTLESTPILDSNLMPGDSGSPQFVLGRAVSLSSVANQQRLDIPAVRRFLAPFIWR